MIDDIGDTESYLFIYRRQEDRTVEQTLLIQDMLSRFPIASSAEKLHPP